MSRKWPSGLLQPEKKLWRPIMIVATLFSGFVRAWKFFAATGWGMTSRRWSSTSRSTSARGRPPSRRRRITRYALLGLFSCLLTMNRFFVAICGSIFPGFSRERILKNLAKTSGLLTINTTGVSPYVQPIPFNAGHFLFFFFLPKLKFTLSSVLKNAFLLVKAKSHGT